MPSKYSDDVALETNREETSEESPQNLANPGDNVPPEGRPRDSSVESNDEDDIDYRPSTPSENEQDGPQQKSSSRNPFADRQNFVRQLCDTSLLAANVSQLRAVLDGSSTENIYFWPLIVMISLSILMHIGFGILMIQRWRKEREAEMEHRRNSSSVAGTPTPDSNVLAKQAKGTLCFCSPCLMVEKYDEISLFFMLLLVVLNVGIAGLGL